MPRRYATTTNEWNRFTNNLLPERSGQKVSLWKDNSLLWILRYKLNTKILYYRHIGKSVGVSAYFGFHSDGIVFCPLICPKANVLTVKAYSSQLCSECRWENINPIQINTSCTQIFLLETQMVM